MQYKMEDDQNYAAVYKSCAQLVTCTHIRAVLTVCTRCLFT